MGSSGAFPLGVLWRSFAAGPLGVPRGFLGSFGGPFQAVVSVRFPGSQVSKKLKHITNNHRFGDLFGYVELYAPRHRDLHNRFFLFLQFLRPSTWIRKSPFQSNIPKQRSGFYQDVGPFVVFVLSNTNVFFVRLLQT